MGAGAQRVPETMTMYREAMDEFSKNATEFLEHIALLTKARDAFQRAMTVRETLIKLSPFHNRSS